MAQVELCAQNIFSFHLLFRAMSHALHRTPSMLSSISFSSTSFSFTGSASRLITSRIHCADSRDLGGDGCTDPEPHTGNEPKETVDNPIVTEKEIEHSTEESQIPEIEDKCKELIFDKFSLPKKPVVVVFDSRFYRALLHLKKQTGTTNKFVLCLLHHGVYRGEKHVRNDHTFIFLKEKV